MKIVKSGPFRVRLSAEKEASRDRPKSAPYLRLKNTKRTSKCQSIGELGTLLWNFFRKKVSQCRKKLKGGTIWDFSKSILSKNIKKLKVGLFGEKKYSKKSLIEPKIILAPLSFLNDIKILLRKLRIVRN